MHPQPNPGRAQRVTGHLKLIQRREGPVWHVKTRVPGRTPEQTTRRLAPAHTGGGKPRAGHLTRRQAEDALADILTAERRHVRQGAYDHQPDGATFAEAAAGFLRHVEHVKGRELPRSRTTGAASAATSSDGRPGPSSRSPPPTSSSSATTSWPPGSRRAPSSATSPWRTASSSTPSAPTA
jgi:hypothetical protein